jgi:hypothetical protein
MANNYELEFRLLCSVLQMLNSLMTSLFYESSYY